MRILLIVESSGGGTGRHVLDLAEGLIARGCEVHLIYSKLRADRLFLDRLHAIEGLRPVALRMLTAPHLSDISVVQAIREYAIENGPFDIVHGHSSKGGAHARLVAMTLPAKSIYTLHGLILMDPGLPFLKRVIYLAIEQFLSFVTSRIIAVSPEEQRAAVRCGFGAHKVVLVPNGVGPRDLKPRAEARKELEIEPDEIVIGFIGRLVEQKGCDVLIKGFANAARVVPNLRLVMVGSGPLESDLRDLAVSMGVRRQILWLGECDADTVMAAFDIFALASCKEGLPYVILEAMAAGLPIVATESAGVEILVDPGVNGFVVPTGNVRAFGDALQQLAGDRRRIAQYGEGSRAKAEDFTIDTMVDRTCSVYRDALGQSVSEARPGIGKFAEE